MDELDTAADAAPSEPRPPQGIVPRFLSTGNPARDNLLVSPMRSVPRIDPASLIVDGQSPFLALPIAGDQVHVRVRQFNPELASEILTRQVAQAEGIRLATDEEVAAYHAEAAERAAQMEAERDRRARAELERYLGEQRHREATQRAVRAFSDPKSSG